MNVGDTVYVRWYGDVVEGKVVDDGNVLTPDRRMIVVRIPIQGLYCQAVFVPEHVYKNAAEAMAVSPTVEMPIQRIIPSTENPSGDYIYKQIEDFKNSHWDHDHNHLQVEALDEFYEIWKASSKPILFIPKQTSADIDKLAEEYANYNGKIFVSNINPTILLEPNTEPVSQNDTPSNKPKKSNPTVIQLSLFD